MSTPRAAVDALTDIDDAGQLSLATAGDQLALLLAVDEAEPQQLEQARRGPCAACEYDHPEGAPCRALTIEEGDTAP